MDDRERPQLQGVLETVLYYEDQGRAESFYRDVLGMKLLSKQEGRSLFFRAGADVFLLFDADATMRAGELPPHGARGPGHVCFVVDSAQYELWKRYLADHNVEVLKESEWSPADGGKLLSFYFRDPDGNLLEIANGDLWPN